MMTKAEFVSAMKDALPEVFTSKASAEKAYDVFCDILANAVSKGEGARLPGVGSFSVVQRAARTGRNPQTGKAITIPARKAVKFSVAKGLSEGLK
jgi:Bacterial nucleoid DNA-binding protein